MGIKGDGIAAVGVVPGSEIDSSDSSFAIRQERYTLKPALDRLSKADPANVMEVAASQLELMNHYHNVVIGQARNSFLWALIAAGVGLLFLMFSVCFVLLREGQDAAIISLISGALIEFISGINFYLYGRTSKQLAEFQSRLDVTQRFLIANSIAAGMQGDAQQKARWELVRTISGMRQSLSEYGGTTSPAPSPDPCTSQ